jgi:hypothetical protein
MTRKIRDVAVHQTQWRGITLKITYEANWYNSTSAYRPAHIEIWVRQPYKAALPITGTGYRSHFVDPDRVDQAGGPVAYVTAWLNAVASEKWWREYEAASRQVSLF